MSAKDRNILGIRRSGGRTGFSPGYFLRKKNNVSSWEHRPERIDVKPFVDLITHWTQIVKNERINWFKGLSKK